MVIPTFLQTFRFTCRNHHRVDRPHLWLDWAFILNWRHTPTEHPDGERRRRVEEGLNSWLELLFFPSSRYEIVIFG